MFWHIDDRLPAHIQAVLDTAALLDITEFRVFELAYVNWYGRKADARQIEPLFVDYMFNDAVPPWVGQFTRKILRAYNHRDQGEVDRGALGLQPVTRQAHHATRGAWYLLSLTLSLALLIILANSAVEVLSFFKECYFPPCY